MRRASPAAVRPMKCGAAALAGAVLCLCASAGVAVLAMSADPETGPAPQDQPADRWRPPAQPWAVSGVVRPLVADGLRAAAAGGDEIVLVGPVVVMAQSLRAMR